MSCVIKNKVHKARKSHWCDGCGKLILPGQRYRRMFGSAYESDPRRELKLCSGCSDLDGKNDGHGDIHCLG